MYSVFPPLQSSTLVYDPINRKINLDSLSDFFNQPFFVPEIVLRETVNP